MELIIEIPEEQYNDIVKYLTNNDGNYAYSDFNLREIIRNGTPYIPSGDCISREDLKKAIEPYRYAICGFEGILAIIDNAQAVDLWQMRQEATENALKKAEVLYARPKGEWIRVEPTEEDIEQNLVPLERIECSNCHLPNRHIQYDEYHDEMTVTYHNTHYCPNCGAEMSISKGKDV